MLSTSVGAPACGDVMKLQIRVDDTGRISDVKFKTFGCGSAIASSSFMTERVKGLTLEEAGAIRNTEVAKELSLPPVKCNHTLPHFISPIIDPVRWLTCSALFDVGGGCG
jgi:NifU-like protein involved in Fe-S cluster formation